VQHRSTNEQSNKKLKINQSMLQMRRRLQQNSKAAAQLVFAAGGGEGGSGEQSHLPEAAPIC
jgi:methyl-accepting chemotaxis protein